MAKLPDQFDITLHKVNEILEKREFEKTQTRHYLGMSEIGNSCWRALFYSFRKIIKKRREAFLMNAAEDGWHQEDVMAGRLKLISEIELITKDENEKQIEFSLLLGHLAGHVDGMIYGILEAPETWHVWEHKAKNQKSFNSLKKIRDEKGEKNALQEWDEVYYAQAQLYMHCSQVTRHYMTVSLPGGRDYISIRTDYNKKQAEALIEKAKSIIFDNNLPAKISNKREFYRCKMCDFSEVCHDNIVPDVNCHTCRAIQPVKDGEFHCLIKECDLNKDTLYNADCDLHIFNSALINATLVSQDIDGCVYFDDHFYWANLTNSGFPKDQKIMIFYTSLELKNDVKNLDNIVQKKKMKSVVPQKKQWDKKLKV